MKPISIALKHIMNIYNALQHMMNAHIKHCMWLGLGLTQTLLTSMIIQRYRHIITHFKYVHNAL